MRFLNEFGLVMCNTTGETYGAVSAYPSWVPEISPIFVWVSYPNAQQLAFYLVFCGLF